MSTPTITVRIDPQGKPTVEADGVTGESCLSLTEALEAKLGRSAERMDKPERFEPQQHGQDQSVEAGGAI